MSKSLFEYVAGSRDVSFLFSLLNMLIFCFGQSLMKCVPIVPSICFALGSVFCFFFFFF